MIGYIKRQLHKRKTQRPDETPEQESARRTANATVAIAWFTVALFVTSAVTLYMVIDGGNDTRKIAQATSKQSEDIDRILRGAQEAVVQFSVAEDIERGDITLTANNVGKIDAKALEANLLVMIKDWPTKQTRLGPFPHEVMANRIGAASPLSTNMMGTDHRIDDRFIVPQMTRQVVDDLMNGRAYLTVEWSAHYDDGFGTIVHWPENRGPLCEAWMVAGHVRCARFDGGFSDHGQCDGIDSMRAMLEARMADSRKHNCGPN